MALNFEADDWAGQGWNYMKLRVWEAIIGAIKTNLKNRD
jgi:hypothetical protein